MQEGAFDGAVQGVDAVEHIASPYRWNAVEPDGTRVFVYNPGMCFDGLSTELINPAVRGTLGILNSVFKNGRVLHCPHISNRVD